jgi:hypothetical protein
MKKKLFVSAMLVCLLALGLAFVGCSNGSTDDGPNLFTLNGITNAMKTEGDTAAYVGLFPVSTSKTDAQTDVNAFRQGNTTTYIVAGEDVQGAITGSSDNYSLSGPLKSASSDFTSDWSGGGSFHIWFALLNGSTWTLYRTNNPVDLTSGGSTTLNAVLHLSEQP